MLRAEHAPRVRVQRDDLAEYGERVLEDVEMVKRALTHVAQRIELGQHARTERQLDEHPNARHGALAHDNPQ